MITLTATISILSGIGTLSGVSSNRSPNNISANLSNILGVRSQSRTPFIIGASKISSGEHFSDGESYFIGSIRSNENGQFTTPYEITVTGSNISALIIEFDTANKRFPTSIVVDGTTYDDDDSVYSIPLSRANSHTIIINNWNTPEYPLVITGIYVNLTIDVDRKNLISIERELADRGDFSMPTFGIISNSGRMSFNDVDGEIKDFAEAGLLKEGLEVDIYINNTLVKVPIPMVIGQYEIKKELIGQYKTNDWNYDNYNRQVDLTFKDDLEEWQDINIDPNFTSTAVPYPLVYTPTVSIQQTFEYIYKWLYAQTPAKYNMLSFENLDNATQEILTNTIMPYPMIEAGNLWASWQKLCEVCLLHIYKENGVTVCKYNGGN